jgi:hypothetical protein
MEDCPDFSVILLTQSLTQFTTISEFCFQKVVIHLSLNLTKQKSSLHFQWQTSFPPLISTERSFFEIGQFRIDCFSSTIRNVELRCTLFSCLMNCSFPSQSKVAGRNSYTQQNEKQKTRHLVFHIVCFIFLIVTLLIVKMSNGFNSNPQQLSAGLTFMMFN